MAIPASTEALRSSDARRLVSELGTIPTRSWPLLIDDLLALREFKDDWDGQGAEAPKPGVIDAAVGLAREFQAAQVPPADHAIAGVNGTVYFEWHGTQGYLEIEVMANRTEARAVRKGSDVTEVFALAGRSSPA
ncbi:MAG TPA: hypothetical protein VL371_04865 [Gemmataceae bacterium]|nr:hypothetical protein [Gemmataceae bacterium]